MKFLILLICALAVTQNAHGRIFSRCDLARQLSGTFPRHTLADWNCLVQAESNYNSRNVGPPNNDGSRDWGIFQINDRYWCRVGYPGGDCNIDCNRLIDDDISDDIRCAQKIFGRHGYNAWYGWINKCKGRSLQGVDDCF